jgi:hypothetical protein
VRGHQRGGVGDVGLDRRDERPLALRPPLQGCSDRRGEQVRALVRRLPGEVAGRDTRRQAGTW